MASTIPDSASPTTDVRKTGIVVRFKPTNLTSEKYDEALRKHESAVGGLGANKGRTG
jgi:hypothetical protein